MDTNIKENTNTDIQEIMSEIINEISPTSVSEPVSILNQINNKLYESIETKYLVDRHISVKSNDKWYEISFSSPTYNYNEICQLIELHKNDLSDLTLDNTIIKNISNLSYRKFKYVGNACKELDILKFYYDTLNIPFHYPVDMSHIYKSPCLLRFSFCTDKPFDKQWDSIKKLRKNKGNFIEKDNNWTQHIEAKNNWIDIITTNTTIPMFCNKYTEPDINGISVIITSNTSFWTFSCNMWPTISQNIIDKFSLKRIAC